MTSHAPAAPPAPVPPPKPNPTREALRWAAFGLLMTLVVVATLQFYFAAQEAIARLAHPTFVPVFQAVFALVVVLGSVWAIREYLLKR